MTPHAARATKAKKTRRGIRGIALTEYAFLLTFIGVPAIIGFTAGGIMLYTSYRSAQVEVWRGSP